MKKIAVVFTAVMTLTAPMHSQATAYLGTLTLPVYDEGLPDPNPPFDEYATSRMNYPYPLRDNITARRTQHTFRAIYLENEYLKCSILPDVGGHIYTCIDKINNVPMFYANPSLKEAQIGMRGGWAAFGEEFNFPVSHSWTTVSPIDFALTKTRDGNAVATLSNVERVSGMQWTVEVVLRPGTTLLELHVTLNNRDDIRHRFYWWSNAGVQVWDDSRICYPMRFTAAHGYADVDRWPIDSNGVDMSILKNQVHGPVSRFIHGSREPFMGIWNPKTDAGVAHYADYSELPGKKIWSWGADADAMDWRQALSDDHSAYMEVQAGLFRNQETFAFLEPRQSIHFNEYWMPLRGLGGLARANLAGAVNMSRSGSSLTVDVNVNRHFDGATVRILDANTVIRSSTQTLVPERTWKQDFPLSDTSHSYTVEVRDVRGKVILSQTEGQYDWTPENEIHVGPQPAEALPAASQRNEDDWLQAGRDEELNGKLLVAAATYRDAMKLFPRSESLSIASGRLAVALLQYHDAILRLTSVQARDTPNAQVAYYLGLAYDDRGDSLNARTQYETAAHLPDLRAAAALRLGELEARSNNLTAAVMWLKASLAAAPDDLRTAEELTAVLHANAQTSASRKFATAWHKRFPTSYFLSEELGAPQMEHLAAAPERVLIVAAEYIRLGQYGTALHVLSRQYAAVPPSQAEPGATLPQDNVMVAYYKAFCLKQLRQPSEITQATASYMSVRYVFPNGQLSDAVLRSAIKTDPHDATALDLLGTLEFSIGMTADAQTHWDTAHTLNPSLPALDANRGAAALYVMHDPLKAFTAFRQGIQNDLTNQANYIGLDQALSQLQHAPDEFIHAARFYPDPVAMPAKLVYELALHNAEAGNFSSAEALFRDRFFPREENGTNVRLVWLDVELERLQNLASNNQCDEAMAGLRTLNKPTPGMTFTNDGMEPLIAVARAQLQRAHIATTCHQDIAAQAALTNATHSSDLDDAPWAYLAAKQLPDFDEHAWQIHLQDALHKSERRSNTHPFSMLLCGLIQMEQGHSVDARRTLQQIFLMPDDKLSYHLARLALSQLNETK